MNDLQPGGTRKLQKELEREEYEKWIHLKLLEYEKIRLLELEMKLNNNKGGFING